MTVQFSFLTPDYIPLQALADGKPPLAVQQDRTVRFFEYYPHWSYGVTVAMLTAAQGQAPRHFITTQEMANRFVKDAAGTEAALQGVEWALHHYGYHQRQNTLPSPEILDDDQFIAEVDFRLKSRDRLTDQLNKLPGTGTRFDVLKENCADLVTNTLVHLDSHRLGSTQENLCFFRNDLAELATDIWPDDKMSLGLLAGELVNYIGANLAHEVKSKAGKTTSVSPAP